MKLRMMMVGLMLAGSMVAQDSKQPSQLKPQTTQAPGAGPDKVWVNTKSNVYHCPSDRFYGRTKNGKYMTEKDAKAAGAHGEKGQTCFK